jgi:peptide chain release factor subunit 1
MAKSTTALETPLRQQLDRLAAFEPVDAPVLSLYLDMRPDQNGRLNVSNFLTTTLAERARTLQGDARASFDRDVQRITAYLDGDVRKSANGLAIFACAAAGDFFEAVQLDVPIEQHWLYIGAVPHLYQLARINDQFPRYAALLVDTNSARLFVFGLGAPQNRQRVDNPKTRRSQMGGWSQARYQRHIANFHLHHMKEVVDLLERVVREESIGQVVVACDEVARPILMSQLPQHLADKVVDVVKLDIRTPEQEVLAETLETLRGRDAITDAEHVERMLDGWRGNGLGVAGPEATLEALEMGQVEELLITADPTVLTEPRRTPTGAAAAPVAVDTSAQGNNAGAAQLTLADQLVTKAQQTSARIRFIENPDLLADVGGVGAILRFRI